MYRTDGGYGVPGMPGNGGVYTAGNPSFDIGPRSPFKGMTRDELEELKRFDDRPQDLQRYYDRINAPGPQLPLAQGFGSLPGPIGNVGGVQNAQFYLGPQLGQVPVSQVPAGFQGGYVS
jgi:hypothetical protein